MADDAGNVTSYEYDALNRMIRKVNADSTEVITEYDRESNIVRITDPNGSLMDYSYDINNRRIQVDITRATGVVGSTLESYEYDGLDRLTKTTDDNGDGPDQTISYVYDSLSRVIEEQRNGQLSARYTLETANSSVVFIREAVSSIRISMGLIGFRLNRMVRVRLPSFSTSVRNSGNCYVTMETLRPRPYWMLMEMSTLAMIL